MSELIPRVRVQLHDEHVRAVTDALQQGHLARGPHRARLAAQLCTRFGRRHAVLTTNGFSALLASLQALGPSRVTTAAAGTCFAMVNAILAAGASPDFADLDPETAGLPAGCPGDTLISPDHFGITSVASELPPSSHTVIQDAAQSFLSASRRRSSAAALVLSFYPTKTVPGIDGGAVLTDDEGLHDRLERLVSYEDQSEYEPGARANLGMPDLHAAIAGASVARADIVRQTLLGQFGRLRSSVISAGLRVLEPRVGDVPTRCMVVYPDRRSRDAAMAYFRERRIETGIELGWLSPSGDRNRFPVAAMLIDTTLSLPMYDGLADRELSAIEAAVCAQ